MRRSLFSVLLAFVGAACAGSRSSVPASEQTRPPTIQMELPVAPDTPDVPRLIVRDALLAKGYVVEVSAFADNAIAIHALQNGTLDFARIPLPQILAAIQQGADITIVVGGGDHSRVLASARELESCSDLHQRQVAVPNMVSVQTLALKRYLATKCKDVNAELVVIAGVDNRLAALLAGRVAAALLESANMFELERVHGSRFNVLVDLAVEFPNLNGAAVVTRRAFVQQYPTVVREFVREMILAIRHIYDPAALARAMERYLESPPARAAFAAKAYLDRKAVDPNGGLSDEVLTDNINFYVEAGVLKPGLTPEEVADRSHLNAVLAELGRR